MENTEGKMELENLQDDFQKMKMELSMELDKLPKSLNTIQKTREKVALLQEKHKVAQNGKQQPQLSPETIKLYMETICNHADLLKLKMDNEKPLSVAEMKSITEKLTNETMKIKMVSDYLTEASTIPNPSVCDTSDIESINSSFSDANNTFEGVNE